MNRNLRLPALLAVLASCAWSEPYIAVRTGFKCSVCHVNGTGGGKRTDYGNVYSQYKLLMATPLNDSLPYSFDPRLNKAISLGANYRVEQVRTMAYTYQGKTQASADKPYIREANLYVNIDLVKNFLSAYADETVGNGPASNREMWASIKPTSNSWFKFGNMLLPYGYRMMDDLAFIRSGTNFTYNRSGLGYEIGYEPGPLSLVANVTADQFSSVGSAVLRDLPVVRTVRVGGSYADKIRKAARGKNKTYGGFGGFSMGMLTFLGEMDWIQKDDSLHSIAQYMEMDVLPVQGFNLKFAFEYYRPDTKIAQAQNGQIREIVGVEPFLTSFLQLGLYYRKNDWIPQADNGENQDEIYGRLHVFF